MYEDFTKTSVDLPTTAVRIGDLMWTTFPGEMFSNIGKQVKAASPATYAHLMGYTNGYLGYFPERKAYSEGGYEVSRTHFDPAVRTHLFTCYRRADAALSMRGLTVAGPAKGSDRLRREKTPHPTSSLGLSPRERESDISYRSAGILQKSSAFLSQFECGGRTIVSKG